MIMMISASFDVHCSLQKLNEESTMPVWKLTDS